MIYIVHDGSKKARFSQGIYHWLDYKPALIHWEKLFKQNIAKGCMKSAHLDIPRHTRTTLDNIVLLCRLPPENMVYEHELANLHF